MIYDGGGGSYDDYSVCEEVVEFGEEVLYSNVGCGTWGDRRQYSLVLCSCRNIVVIGRSNGTQGRRSTGYKDTKLR